jgi:hypothetical protein
VYSFRPAEAEAEGVGARTRRGADALAARALGGAAAIAELIVAGVLAALSAALVVWLDALAAGSVDPLTAPLDALDAPLAAGSVAVTRSRSRPFGSPLGVRSARHATTDATTASATTAAAVRWRPGARAGVADAYVNRVTPEVGSDASTMTSTECDRRSVCTAVSDASAAMRRESSAEGATAVVPFSIAASSRARTASGSAACSRTHAPTARGEASEMHASIASAISAADA